jgi:hypothetical protein
LLVVWVFTGKFNPRQLAAGSPHLLFLTTPLASQKRNGGPLSAVVSKRLGQDTESENTKGGNMKGMLKVSAVALLISGLAIVTLAQAKDPSGRWTATLGKEEV